MYRAKLHLAPVRFVALHLRKNSPARGKGKSHFLKERHKYSPNPTIYTVKQPSNLWSCESRLGQPWPHHWRCSNLGFPLNPQVQSWDRLGEETKGTMCYPCGPEARLSPVSNRPILQVERGTRNGYSLGHLWSQTQMLLYLLLSWVVLALPACRPSPLLHMTRDFSSMSLPVSSNLPSFTPRCSDH